MNISDCCIIPSYILPLLPVSVSLRYCRSNLSNDPTQIHVPADSAESQEYGRVEIEIYASEGGEQREREDVAMGLQVRQIPLARSKRLFTQPNLQPYHSIPYIPPLLPCRSESARFHLTRLQLIAAVANFSSAQPISDSPDTLNSTNT